MKPPDALCKPKTFNCFHKKLLFDFRAAVGRAVSLAVEEMTRTTEVIEAVQLPCSKILVRLGSRKHVDRIMDAVLSKFQPGATSHFYVLATLSELAISNPTHVVPFLKAILGTMLATMKSVKKDQLRYSCKLNEASQKLIYISVDLRMLTH